MSGVGSSLPPTQGWPLRAVRHELRTPLNAVLGLSEALLSDVDGPLSEGQRENLTVIATTARRLSDLFDDVLELSGEAPFDLHRTREAVDVGVLLDDLAVGLEHARGTRLVHVRVAAELGLPPVLANPHRLQRLIGSLARYALTTCTSEVLELRASMTQGAPARVRVDIVDPGRQLRVDELQALLSAEPSPLRRKGLDESARLRLSMFRQLAEREGGTFSVHADGEGTHLALALPSAGPPLSEPPPAPDQFPQHASAQPAVVPLEDIERLRTRFLAAMSHDLRGPLNTIIGFAELLVMEQHDAVLPEQRPAVDHIRQSAHDLLSLLDNTLDWARLDTGQLALHYARLELDEVLAEACTRAVDRSGARGLTIDLGGGAPPKLSIRADRGRLVQSLLGLLDHATRATGNPKVGLRIELLRAQNGMPCARITINDPGLRVRDQDQPGFFAPFRPSFEPSGRRVAGLGVGPAVARALIRAHGGDVWFASDGERGTTFTLELPAA